MATIYKVMVNGELTDTIFPHRAIRQGDPLSPYLFIIILSEALSKIIAKYVEDGKISGLKVNRYSPAITHLFFFFF